MTKATHNLSTLELGLFFSPWLTNHFSPQECERLKFIPATWGKDQILLKELVDALFIIVRCPSLVTHEKMKELKDTVKTLIR